MSDRELRALERAHAEGDAGALRRLLVAKQRHGSQDRVALCDLARAAGLLAPGRPLDFTRFANGCCTGHAFPAVRRDDAEIMTRAVRSLLTSLGLAIDLLDFDSWTRTLSGSTTPGGDHCWHDAGVSVRIALPSFADLTKAECRDLIRRSHGGLETAAELFHTGSNGQETSINYWAPSSSSRSLFRSATGASMLVAEGLVFLEALANARHSPPDTELVRLMDLRCSEPWEG